MGQKVCFDFKGYFLVLFLSFENFNQKQKLSLDNFRQFCFWTHQNLDAPCGSKSGLVFLDWCDGAAAGEAGGGKRFHNCLMVSKNGDYPPLQPGCWIF